MAIGIVWKPLALDTINVNAGARTTNASVPYSSVQNTNYSASWTHDWLDRVNTVVSLGSSTDDYDIAPGVVASARSDDVTTYGVALNYQMRRWLILNAAINTSNKDSNVSSFNNKRNVMSIGAQVSL